MHDFAKEPYITGRLRTPLLLLIISACVAFDQLTKATACQYLRGSRPASLFSGILRLECIENPGAFQSLGANLTPDMRFWLFTVAVGVAIVGMLVCLLLQRRPHPLKSTAMAVVLGGGASNLLDRFLRDGSVVDFMSVRVWIFITGIFNMADVMITVGLILLLFANLRRRRPAGRTSNC